MSTVSGRRYTRTRPRGFVAWNPRPATKLLIEQILAVLDEYADDLPLTARMVFYRLVGAYDFPKEEHAYERLGEVLTRGRRAQLIPMDAIRDDGAHWNDTPGITGGPAAFWDTVRSNAAAYQRRLDEDQEHVLEVWVEAVGMLSLIRPIAHAYGAGVASCGGFDSVTAKYATAHRIAKRDRETIILSLGDHDPSGLSILDSAAEDVTVFVEQLGGTPPAFARLAVTPEQVRHYQLPTAPQKPRDRHGAHMPHTVQAEAVPPDALKRELHAGLAAFTNLDTLHRVRRQSDNEREYLVSQTRRLNT
ncbi:hypothetical protein ACIBCO_35790 [Streptomyces violascens]|uniref:hypothetical protein n=1 Tax=Streptomyces violascens TaxID=67381 RepID=UPI0037987EEA